MLYRPQVQFDPRDAPYPAAPHHAPHRFNSRACTTLSHPGFTYAGVRADMARRQRAGVRVSTPSTVQLVNPSVLSFPYVYGQSNYTYFLLPLAYITVNESGELTITGSYLLDCTELTRGYPPQPALPGWAVTVGVLGGTVAANKWISGPPTIKWLNSQQIVYDMAAVGTSTTRSGTFNLPPGVVLPAGQYTLAGYFYIQAYVQSRGGTITMTTQDVLIRDGGQTSGSLTALDNLYNADPNVWFLNDNRYACGSYQWSAGAAFNLGTFTAATPYADVSAGYHLETGGGGDTDVAYVCLVLVDVAAFLAAGGVLPASPGGENYATLDVKWETPGQAAYTWYSNPTKIYNALRAPGVVRAGFIPLSSVASSTAGCCNTETCFKGLMTQAQPPPNFTPRAMPYGYSADRSYYVVGRDAKVNVILSLTKVPLQPGQQYAILAYMALGIDDRISIKPMRAGQVWTNNYNGANESVTNQVLFYT